jgi:4-amino-4-deoxy-L-arabinose transferase-like glycosyltransferase
MGNFRARWLDLFNRLLSADAVSKTARWRLMVLIIVAFLSLRLWTLGSPLLDRTSWKEIDYIAVSTNYWQHGYNLLWPEVTWPAEPPRVTEMELPVVPYAAALLYPVLGFNVYSVRLVVVFAWLLLVVYVWRLATREMGPVIGLASALATALMVLYHPFGRILHSEPLLVAMSVVAVFPYISFSR